MRGWVVTTRETNQATNLSATGELGSGIKKEGVFA